MLCLMSIFCIQLCSDKKCIVKVIITKIHFQKHKIFLLQQVLKIISKYNYKMLIVINYHYNESSLITIRLVARPLLWLSCTLVYM